MQRTENNFVIISCDFCGSDWDEVKPMIEGHHGSILCLECLKLALPHVNLTVKPSGKPPADHAKAAPPPPSTHQPADTFHCTMCLMDQPGTMAHWRPDPPPPPPGGNPLAVICLECIEQAAGAYDKDKDTDWKWER